MNITRRSSMGFYEEKLFEQSLNKYGEGITCRKATDKEDMFKHIDFFLSDGRKVDVKTHKTVNTVDAKVSDEFTWVELINVNGNRGWIDGEATHIVFSLTSHYFIVSREDLIELVKSSIFDSKLYPKDMFPKPYTKYRRNGLLDTVVLVPWSDIKQLDYTTLKRDFELDH